MKESVIQRVAKVLIKTNMSKAAFAKAIGMDTTTFWRQIKGEQALSAKLIEGVLSTFPDISAEWLLRGEGEMYRNNSEQNKELTFANPQTDSVWKAKYEAIKDCYDTLVSTLGTGISKRNTNV